MIRVTLPAIYLVAPLGQYYFVTNPDCRYDMRKPSNTHKPGQDDQAVIEYAQSIGKDAIELTMDELWMFATASENGIIYRINDNYQHYLETGEVRPYDGPKANVEEHEQIFRDCYRLDIEYGRSQFMYVPVIHEGEEIQFVYDEKNGFKVEQFDDDGNLVSTTDTR